MAAGRAGRGELTMTKEQIQARATEEIPIRKKPAVGLFPIHIVTPEN